MKGCYYPKIRKISMQIKSNESQLHILLIGTVWGRTLPLELKGNLLIRRSVKCRGIILLAFYYIKIKVMCLSKPIGGVGG
jgi:hypothetical protein